jgi:hypothetical protein
MLITLIAATLLLALNVVTFQHVRTWWRHDSVRELLHDNVQLLDNWRFRVHPGSMSFAAALNAYEHSDFNHYIDRWKEGIARFGRTKSIAGVAMLTWALYILFRWMRRRPLPPWLKVKWLPSWMLRRARLMITSPLTIIRRVTTVVSIICFSAFVVTGHAKWLIGVIPLWSVVISVIFFVNFVVSWMWLRAGKMPY